MIKEFSGRLKKNRLCQKLVQKKRLEESGEFRRTARIF